MLEAGILTEDDRVELIDGEIIETSPIGSSHSGCVIRLTALLTRLLGSAAVVSVQNPLRLDDYTEPLPDVTLLKARDDFYSHSHPTPADVLLIVEVADSSLAYDRDVKVPLYARAGVPEVWLVDLVNDVVELYAQPAGGAYAVAEKLRRGQRLVARQVAALTLGVEDILG